MHNHIVTRLFRECHHTSPYTSEKSFFQLTRIDIRGIILTYLYKISALKALKNAAKF